MLTHSAFTHGKRLRTHRNFYTETLLHTEKLLHTASFYEQNLLHTASFDRKTQLYRDAFLYITTTGIAAPKPDLDAKAKKNDFETLLKRTSKRKTTSAKIKKICLTNHFRSLDAATPPLVSKKSKFTNFQNLRASKNLG